MSAAHPWAEARAAAAAAVSRVRPEGREGDITFRRDDKGWLVSPDPLRWAGPGGGLAGRLVEMGPPAGFLAVADERGAAALRPDPAHWAPSLLAHLLGPAPLPPAPDTGQTWLVEHSQPNTHKAFHVGHLRNVVTGDFMARAARQAGHKVVAANYVGDIGTHVLRALLGWERAGRPEPPEGEDKSAWLGGMYAAWAREEGALRDAFLDAAWESGAGADDPKMDRERLGNDKRLVGKLLEQGRQGELAAAANEAAAAWDQALARQNEIAARWAARDPQLVAEWERTRGWCLEAFDAIYQSLHVEFDVVWYESEVEEEAVAVAADLVSRGLAREEGGATIVDFREPPYELPKLGVLPLTRSDGLPLYSAKDLALARVKERERSPHLSIYVVASPQSHYFRQVFAILAGMGLAPEGLRHVPYELVELPGGQMSSRAGTIVPLAALWEEALSRVAARSRDPKGPDVAVVAEGALKHAMLARDLNRKLAFRWDEVLSVEGRTGPYLQYAGVRAARILATAGEVGPAPPPPEVTPPEEALLFQLLTYPESMERALASFSPLPLVDALHRVARAFTDLYHAHRVLASPEPERAWRLALVAATRATLERGLSLLGISLPAAM